MSVVLHYYKQFAHLVQCSIVNCLGEFYRVLNARCGAPKIIGVKIGPSRTDKCIDDDLTFTSAVVCLLKTMCPARRHLDMTSLHTNSSPTKARAPTNQVPNRRGSNSSVDSRYPFD